MPYSDHISARLVKLPYRVSALSSVDENGEPMIYLNARHTYERNRRAFEHEIMHIRRDDFYNDLTIQEAEAQPDPTPVPQAAVFQLPPWTAIHNTKYKNTAASAIHQAISQCTPEAQPVLYDLFSRPIQDNEEVFVRGWLLFGYRREDKVWNYIFMTWLWMTAHVPDYREYSGQEQRTFTTRERQLIFCLFDNVFDVGA